MSNVNGSKFSQIYGPKWLVEKAQKCLKYDPDSAKALLITARTLHPQEFGIQFEAYCIEKSARNTHPASILLLEMFEQFKQEPALWKELQLITSALKVPTDDEYGLFLQGVFASLPDKAQFDVLLLSADHSKDILEKCQLKLLLINRFPDAIADHGVPLVDMLLDAEKNEGQKLATNLFRRVMVCEVLPIICASKKVNGQPKQYHKWLQKSLEFYTVYATQPPVKPTDLKGAMGPVTPSITPQTGKGQGFGFGELSQPWERLHRLLAMIAEKCGWDAKFVPEEERPFTENWLHINEHYSRAKASEATNIRKPVFYSTLVLFLQAVHGFMSAVDPEQFAGSSPSSSHQPLLVLLEDLECKRRVKKHHKHAHKKRKLDSGEKEGDSDSSDDPVIFHLPPATIRLNKATGVTQEVIDMFQTAVDCWQLLYSSETFEKDFNWLLHRWKADTWPWFTAFQIDRLLYKAEFEQALRMLQEQYKKLSTEQQTGGNQQVLKTLLQTAACYFRQSQHSSACEMTLNAIRHLPPPTKDTPNVAETTAAMEKTYNKSLRHLPLVPCTSSALLPYFLQLLLLSYKKKVFHLRETEDTALGHMVVLMQYDWPKEEALFQELIKKLKKQGSFLYPIFFQYIINIDILEEFSFLKTELGGKLALDLLPPNPSSVRQRTITRNVTKGGKEEFRVAMEKQVFRCGENLDALMRTFLTSESDSLQQLLM